MFIIKLIIDGKEIPPPRRDGRPCYHTREEAETWAEMWRKSAAAGTEFVVEELEADEH